MSVRIALVPGFEKTSPAFKSALAGVARRVGCDPTDLAAVIAFETINTFSPSITNPKGGATGLIQFLPSTARALGAGRTDAEAQANLKKMTDVEQLFYVEKYLRPAKGSISTLAGLYLKIFTGHTSKLTGSDVIFKEGSIEYDWNKSLDYNKDGQITVNELTSGARAKIAAANGRFVEVEEGATGADAVDPLSSSGASPGSSGGSPAPAVDPPVYVVRAGDTLSSIAREITGRGIRWRELQAENHLADPNKIRPGQRLKVPASWHWTPAADALHNPPKGSTR